MMEEAEVAPEIEERPQSPQVPAVEDIAGGELAMEICNTPPHSPSPPPTPPPPDRLQTPPPPPPPTISESRELSPPPPPRISPFPPAKSNESRRHQKGKGKKRRAPPPVNNNKSGSNMSTQSLPTPPPPDLNPPLPPLPPPPSSPPPPPPSDMPPLPPSSPRQQLAYGEPLPPGVDPGEIPYMARPAPPPVYQNPELSPPPSVDMETYQQHAMQANYVLASYQTAMVQPVQGGPVMDYSGMPYMMHTHMAMPAVIAKPPAKKHKAALHAALDSFYSDLAIMEPAPTPEGVCEAAAVPAPIPAPAEDVSAAPTEPTVEPDVLLKHADSSAKKKKVKKVVGLGLKKRGVSSLVAKWQQVQQEVRRDFETLDQDNDSCQ